MSIHLLFSATTFKCYAKQFTIFPHDFIMHFENIYILPKSNSITNILLISTSPKSNFELLASVRHTYSEQRIVLLVIKLHYLHCKTISNMEWKHVNLKRKCVRCEDEKQKDSRLCKLCDTKQQRRHFGKNKKYLWQQQQYQLHSVSVLQCASTRRFEKLPMDSFCDSE